MKSFVSAYLIILISLIFISDVSAQTNCDFLVRYTTSMEMEENSCGYINSKKDTIIPAGKYVFCYTDTFRNFAIVMDTTYRCIGIDRDENKLYEIKWYDNGPDPLREGLFRIIKNGKTGYANRFGEIVIPTQFECTTPFKNGQAKVSYNCKFVKEGEYTRMESNRWIYIDKSGNRIKSE